MSKQEKAQDHYGNGNDGWNESSETVGIFQGDCPADFGEAGKKQVQPRHGKILVEAVLDGAQSGRPLVQKYIKFKKLNFDLRNTRYVTCVTQRDGDEEKEEVLNFR